MTQDDFYLSESMSLSCGYSWPLALLSGGLRPISLGVIGYCSGLRRCSSTYWNTFISALHLSRKVYREAGCIQLSSIGPVCSARVRNNDRSAKTATRRCLRRMPQEEIEMRSRETKVRNMRKSRHKVRGDNRAFTERSQERQSQSPANFHTCVDSHVNVESA